MQSAPVAPGVGLLGVVIAPLATAVHAPPPLVVLRIAIVCAPFWLAPIAYTVVEPLVAPGTAVRLMRPISEATGAGGLPASSKVGGRRPATRAELHVAPPSVLVQMSPRLPWPVGMPAQVARNAEPTGWLNDGGYWLGQA